MNALKFAQKIKSIMLIGIVCIGIALVVLLFPDTIKTNHAVDLSQSASINTICELATLKSFYHNVVMLDKEPSGTERFINDILIWPFGRYAKIGQGQYWLEYSGVVETGIDASKVKIGNPNSEGIVDIYVPDAMILNAYADENSLSVPLTATGIFTEITGEEKIMAFTAAQKLMRQEAENDHALLNRAKENAKTILERYVLYTGQKVGKELSVRWNSTP